MALALAGLGHPGFTRAEPLSGSARWNYAEIDNGEQTSWSSDQSYSLFLDKELTAAMNLDSTLRYNINQSDDSASDNTRISPTVNLDILNDLFSLNLGATCSWLDYDRQPSYESKSWNANWFSKWAPEWPRLHLFYNESYRKDDLSPHTSNSKSSQAGALFNYAWRFVTCSYNVRRSEDINRAGNTSTVTDYHYGTVELRENWNFWENKMSVGVTQRITAHYTETAREAGSGSTFFIEAMDMEGLYGLDSTPDEGTLAPLPALIDNNLLASAGIAIESSLDYHNIGGRANDRPVTQIRIHFDRELSQIILQGLEWQLFASEDGEEWQTVPGLPTITYELDSQTTHSVAIIDLPVSLSDYFKVVLRTSNNLIEAVTITELEAGEEIAAANKLTTDAQYLKSDSHLSLALKPTAQWTLHGSLRHEDSSYDPGRDQSETNFSLRSDYDASRYWWLTLGFDENHQQDEGEDNEYDRSYSAVVKSSPLDTLDLSLGFRRTEQYEGGTHTSSSNNLDGYLTAQLYPDVTAGLQTSWVNDDDVSAFRWRFNTTARLTDRIYLDGYYYDGDSSSSYGMHANFRPSDILSLTTRVDHQETNNQTTWSTNLAWVCSSTILTNVSYSLSESAGDSSHAFNGSLSFIPCSRLDFRMNAGYRTSTGHNNIINWNLQCNLRY